MVSQHIDEEARLLAELAQALRGTGGTTAELVARSGRAAFAFRAERIAEGGDMTSATARADLPHAHRPSQQLDRHWDAAEHADMPRIQATSPTPETGTTQVRPARRRRRRWSAAAALIGAAAAAIVLLQILLPPDAPGGSSSAVAATLERLATTAQKSPADLVQPGQYRHLIDRQSDGSTLESWTSDTGEIWRRDNDNGALLYYNFPPGTHDINYPSPRFLATLPTDPVTLQAYLRSHVSGSTSTDEAVFVGVGDMLRPGFAPPGLRAAAIRVLEHTGHITAQSARDTLGRDAVQVTFTDNANRPGQRQSLFFDPDTSALLQEQDHDSTGSFISTYTDVSVVSAVPADVISNAAKPQQAPSLPGAGATTRVTTAVTTTK